MPAFSREVRTGPKQGYILNEHGVEEPIPAHWSLLPPGDTALSRRIKQDGPSLTVVEIVGRRRFSRGIWAPAERIELLRAELSAERRDPSYQRKLEAGRQRRATAQTVYTESFRRAVLAFLAFHSRYAAASESLATLIADHATPVGSGTVARTERIPIEERAEAASIAWLRHQTTGYDSMRIPLIKGRRREVRRLLAQRSLQLLSHYRHGREIDATHCPLQVALRKAVQSPDASASPPAPIQGILL